MADRLTAAGSANSLGSLIEIPGPWTHRYVAANGARFHVTETGPPEGHTVLLLHGFPEFWWAWRDQLPALAAAGYRAVAMDLRGYGGSDKTPNGYDPVTLSQDVSGVVKALGAGTAVVVGHGWGGYVGWATAALHPREVSALCAVSAPHPRTHRLDIGRSPRRVTSSVTRRAPGVAGPGRQVGVLRHLLAMQLPMVPERRLADASSGFLGRLLRSWSAPRSPFPDDAAVSTYQRAISIWPASHCALEYHRWLVRSRLRADGRRFRSLMRSPVDQPVCTVWGAEDPVLPGARPAGSYAPGGLTEHRMPGVGHFPHEEDPAAFTGLLLAWLGQVTGVTGVTGRATG